MARQLRVVPQTVGKPVIGYMLKLRRCQRCCPRNSHDLVVKVGQTLTGFAVNTRHFIQHLSARFMFAVALLQVKYQFIVRPGRCVDDTQRISAFVLNGGEEANRLVLIRPFEVSSEPFKLLFETGPALALEHGHAHIGHRQRHIWPCRPCKSARCFRITTSSCAAVLYDRCCRYVVLQKIYINGGCIRRGTRLWLLLLRWWRSRDRRGLAV